MARDHEILRDRTADSCAPRFVGNVVLVHDSKSHSAHENLNGSVGSSALSGGIQVEGVDNAVTRLPSHGHWRIINRYVVHIRSKLEHPRYNLNPIPIQIKNKSNMPDLPILWPLLKLDPQLFKRSNVSQTFSTSSTAIAICLNPHPGSLFLNLGNPFFPPYAYIHEIGEQSLLKTV